MLGAPATGNVAGCSVTRMLEAYATGGAAVSYLGTVLRDTVSRSSGGDVPRHVGGKAVASPRTPEKGLAGAETGAPMGGSRTTTRGKVSSASLPRQYAGNGRYERKMGLIGPMGRMVWLKMCVCNLLIVRWFAGFGVI